MTTQGEDVSEALLAISKAVTKAGTQLSEALVSAAAALALSVNSKTAFEIHSRLEQSGREWDLTDIMITARRLTDGADF